MMDVTGFAQHLLSQEPAKNAARLSLYHYLKNMCEAGDAVTPSLLNAFYARALTFTHWQNNKASLFAEVQATITSYADAHPEIAAQVLPELAKAWTAQDIQVVTLESQASLVAMLVRTLETELGPTEQFRVFPEGRETAVTIVMGQDKRLRVSHVHPLAKIHDGKLSPLCRDYTLTYGPDLLLEPGQLQQLDIGDHTAARFRFTNDGCKGSLLRGYTFQRYAVMDGGSLHRYPSLFYPLKRLEQFFIHRKSDPMYIELTGILEKASELLTQGHPEGIKFGSQALERGKLAFENIFPDDKLVRLLINNLEKTLALEAARRERSQRPLENENFNLAESHSTSPSAKEWASGASAGSWATAPGSGMAAPLGSDVNAGQASVPSWEKVRPKNSNPSSSDSTSISRTAGSRADAKPIN
ncbi:MAG: hypothetical protein NDI61_08755 [Bdellovibrionaceae bacterium]|nr:hypothetical protein [Pseudobdellovibrionaceae bacterium]